MEAKVRLGVSARPGVELNRKSGKDKDDIAFVKAFDEKWGGRWDAGSNGRKGGTLLDVETYATKLDEAYKAYLAKKFPEIANQN